MSCKKIYIIGLGIILFLYAITLLIFGVQDSYVSSKSILGLIIIVLQYIVIIKIPEDRLEIRNIFTYRIPIIIYIVGAGLTLIGVLQLFVFLFFDFILNDIFLYTTFIGIVMMVVAKYLDFFIIRHKFINDRKE